MYSPRAGRRLPLALCALALTVALPVRMADAQAAPGDGEIVLKLQLCRSIQNRVFRLHCFDGLAQDMSREAAPEPAAPQIAAVPPAAPAVPLPPVRERASESPPPPVAASVAAGPGVEPERTEPVAPATVPPAPDGPVIALTTASPPPADSTSETARDAADAAADAGAAGLPVAALAIQAAPPAAAGSPPTPPQADEAPFDIVVQPYGPGEAPQDGLETTGSVPLPPRREGERTDFSAVAAPIEELMSVPPGEPAEPSEDPAATVRTAALPEPDAQPDAGRDGTVPRSWSVSDWTSPISGVRDISLTRASQADVGMPITLLSFSCSGGTGAVRVMWPHGLAADRVEAALAFDGGEPETHTWSVSPDGRIMSREDAGVMLALAKRVAAAEQVTVQIEGDAGDRAASFRTEGLERHLKDLRAACTG